MKESNVQLSLTMPPYMTYHNQGGAAALLAANPEYLNWYFNECVILECNKRFLHGYTSPEINVSNTSFEYVPYKETVYIPYRLLKGEIHKVIHRMLDNGYGVTFEGADDYYIPEKSWYQENHFAHDGLICGYDDRDKTYSIFAYDQNWKYRVIRSPQASFGIAMRKGSSFLTHGGGFICGIRTLGKPYPLDIPRILYRLREYLNDPSADFSSGPDGKFYGISVQDCLARYMGMLAEGQIPYARKDRRVIRVIFEHKAFMLERLIKVESAFGMHTPQRELYESIAKESERMHLLYACYVRKERKDLLYSLQSRLTEMKKREEDILNTWVSIIEKEI